MKSENTNIPDQTKHIVTISKQALAELPAAEYKGKVILVDTPEDAAKAAEVLRGESVIGFDTETKPSFKRGQVNQVSLLQLSTHSCCFLIRLNHIGLHPDIKAILESPRNLKIGVSIHDDFHHLSRAYELAPDGFIDLQSFVKDYKIADNSLSRIYGILFGHRISKGQRLTNWEAAELTVHQQEYAALDAYACICIYDHLTANKFIPEESKYYTIMPALETPVTTSHE